MLSTGSSITSYNTSSSNKTSGHGMRLWAVLEPPAGCRVARSRQCSVQPKDARSLTVSRLCVCYHSNRYLQLLAWSLKLDNWQPWTPDEEAACPRTLA